MGRLTAEKAHAFYKSSSDVIDQCYSQTLNGISNLCFGEWDCLVCLGDITCGWNERGIDHPSLFVLASKVSKDLLNFFPNTPLYFLPGNHDTGYGRAGGISLSSLNAWQELFGDLWWARLVKGNLLCGVTSSLASVPPGLKGLRSAQEDFVRDVLRRHHGEPWIFFSHSPFSLGGLERIIREHDKTLQAFVFGDFHNHWAWKIAKKFGLRTKKGIFCPSVAPVWARGGGFVELRLENDGSVKSFSGQIPVCQPSWPRINSPIHCLLWMAGYSVWN